MGKMYSATFEEVAVSAVQDLFEIVAPSTNSVVLHGYTISQSSDAGDAQSEMLNVLIHRGTTSGSGGSAVTAAPLVLYEQAYGGTVEANNTSQSTEGTKMFSKCFNVQSGEDYYFTPECRITIPKGERLIIELQTAPADALTMSGTVFFEVID